MDFVEKKQSRWFILIVYTLPFDTLQMIAAQVLSYQLFDHARITANQKECGTLINPHYTVAANSLILVRVSTKQ